MSIVVYAVLAAIMALVILYVLYTHISSLHAKIDALIVAKVPALAPVLTGDHVVQTAQAVGQAVAQSVTALAPQVVTLPGTNQQVSSVTDAFLRSGAGYGRTDAPAPMGSINSSPNWTSFDGHACRVTSEPGKPMTFSVSVGKPFTLSVSEAGTGTDGTGTMTLTAVQNGKEVATITKHFGQAVDLPVPVGDVVVTAVYDKVSTFDVTVRQG